MKPPSLGELRWTVQVVRRVTTVPQPFQADPDHTYTPVLTTRSKVETKSGTADFNRVTIGDDEVSHVFTIRYTTIPFDARDRLRDTVGMLFKILRVEHVDNSRRWMRIHCAQVGATDRASVT
jgi:uncharacterized membrane protein (UPF0127 family)